MSVSDKDRHSLAFLFEVTSVCPSAIRIH